MIYYSESHTDQQINGEHCIILFMLTLKLDKKMGYFHQGAKLDLFKMSCKCCWLSEVTEVKKDNLSEKFLFFSECYGSKREEANSKVFLQESKSKHMDIQ